MIFASMIVGFLIGLLYRFAFAHMQERIGVFMQQNSSEKPFPLFFETITFSFLRILLISSLLTYLLLSQAIHLIIVTLTCCVTMYFFESIKDFAHGKH